MPQQYAITSTKARARKLHDARVPHRIGTYASEDHQDTRVGIFLEETHLGAALRVLDSDIAARYTRSGTEMVELKLFHVSPQTPRPGVDLLLKEIEQKNVPKVVVESWPEISGTRDRDTKRLFESVAGDFLATLGVKKITLVNKIRSTHYMPPRVHPEEMTIFFWVSRREHDSVRNASSSVTNLFGYPLEVGKWRSLPILGDGITIYDENNTGVAELVGNNLDNLFIHYPIVRSDFENGAEIFRRIMERVVALRGVATGNENDLKAKRLEHSRQAYRQIGSERLKLSLEKAQEVVEKTPQSISRLQKQLTSRIRRFEEAKQKIRQLEVDQKLSDERNEKEFDKLLEIPKVSDVVVGGNMINVFTDTLFCENPDTGQYHRIGKFRIEINMKGGIRWFNLTETVTRGFQAPHVDGGGRACLGNMAEVIPDLIARYEIAALIMVAINFVESVNPNDHGTTVTWWPLAIAEEMKGN